MSINVDQKWCGGRREEGGFWRDNGWPYTTVGVEERCARGWRRFVSLIERVRYKIIINVINQVTRPINVLG